MWIQVYTHISLNKLNISLIPGDEAIHGALQHENVITIKWLDASGETECNNKSSVFFFFSRQTLTREKREEAFPFEKKGQIDSAPSIHFCRLAVCDAGRRCLATSCLSYGSYSHRSFLHASVTSSALLHLLIICPCVTFQLRSVSLSLSLKPPLSLFSVFVCLLFFISSLRSSSSAKCYLLLIAPVCLLVNSSNPVLLKHYRGSFTVLSLLPELDN